MVKEINLMTNVVLPTFKIIFPKYLSIHQNFLTTPRFSSLVEVFFQSMLYIKIPDLPELTNRSLSYTVVVSIESSCKQTRNCDHALLTNSIDMEPFCSCFFHNKAATISTDTKPCDQELTRAFINFFSL